MNWDSKERRQFVRIKFPCEITIQGHIKHIISTYAENISAGGIRFVVKKKIKPSSLVGLDLYGIGKEPIVCKGKVMWVFTKKDPCGDGNFLYDTGIEFCRIKKADIDLIKKLVVSIASGKDG